MNNSQQTLSILAAINSDTTLSPEQKVAKLSEHIAMMAGAQMIDENLAKQNAATQPAAATSETKPVAPIATAEQVVAKVPVVEEEGIGWGGIILGTAVVGGLIYGGYKLFRG